MRPTVLRRHTALRRFLASLGMTRSPLPTTSASPLESRHPPQPLAARDLVDGLAAHRYQRLRADVAVARVAHAADEGAGHAAAPQRCDRLSREAAVAGGVQLGDVLGADPQVAQVAEPAHGVGLDDAGGRIARA